MYLTCNSDEEGSKKCIQNGNVKHLAKRALGRPTGRWKEDIKLDRINKIVDVREGRMAGFVISGVEASHSLNVRLAGI